MFGFGLVCWGKNRGLQWLLEELFQVQLGLCCLFSKLPLFGVYVVGLGYKGFSNVEKMVKERVYIEKSCVEGFCSESGFVSGLSVADSFVCFGCLCLFRISSTMISRAAITTTAISTP